MSSTHDDDTTDESSEPSPQKAGPPEAADLAKLLRSRIGGVNFDTIFHRVGFARRFRGVDLSKYTGMQRPPLPGVAFSKIAGMQKARLSGIDFSKLAGLRRPPLVGLNLDKTLGLKPAHHLLGIDFAKITGGAPLARISTGVDFSKIAGIQRPPLPGVDFSKIAGLHKAGLSGIDFSTFTAGFDFSKIAKGLDLAAGFARLYPPNWPDDVDLNQVAEVIGDDGIPLVWVPRESIVAELLQAPDRPARLVILTEQTASLVEDCRSVLESIDEPTLADKLPLAQAVLESYAGGHQEAAQALATVVTETVIARAVSSKYKNVQEFVLFDPARVTWRQLRLKAALAPIHRFYTSWYRSDGQPAPDALSRHVTVHEAHTAHFNPSNALVAVLLVTSVMRAIQELQERSARLDEKISTAA